MILSTRFALSLLALAACSSSGPAAPSAGDAGVGPNRPVGATCDRTLASPCSTPSDICTSVVCDATKLRCTLVTNDAGGCTTHVPTTCTGDAECVGGTCVNGLCYATCLTANDCGDAGVCTTVCPSDSGTGGCKAYCTTPM
jgi:hypothetical protein